MEQRADNERWGQDLWQQTRKQTRVLYDRLAPWYDFLGGAGEKKLASKAIRKLQIQIGETALEIGFGTGQALVELSQQVGRTGSVYGIDLSPKMMAQARNRIKDKQLDARVYFSLGDAIELPYKDESFDLAFLSFTLELFPDAEIPLVLMECNRVLRNEGRLGLVSLSKSGAECFMRRIYEWTHRRFPNWIDCRPIYAEERLVDSGYEIRDRSLEMLWGLPVEIVIGYKKVSS